MENDFVFELGRFTFLYNVLTDAVPLCQEFELDLIEVFVNLEPLTDAEMDVVNCEVAYDLAFEEFKKQRL